MAESERWEEVFATVDEMEAQLVKGLLETNGFPVVVKTTGLKAMAAVYGQSAVGEYKLLVPPDVAEQALAFLEAEPESEETES